MTNPRPLAAVLVCGGECCASHQRDAPDAPDTHDRLDAPAGHQGHAVLEALKPLIRRTPHAVLIRTACLHPHGDCPGDHGSCAVGLQLCDAHLEPLAPCTPLTGNARTAYRRVERWFDETAR